MIKMQVDYTFHPDEVKHLSLQAFIPVLVDNWYPHFFHEINLLENDIQDLRIEYDLDVLSSSIKRIYMEFDELYRKEKLVLFPFLLKLDAEHRKADSCACFNNVKQHYTHLISQINDSLEMVTNIFINEFNSEKIEHINNILMKFKEDMIDIQDIKECYFFEKYKNCGACTKIHE